MLKTLRRIIQDADNADTLPTALNVIVDGVNAAIDTEACSIFLIDAERSENVLAATAGLNPFLVGKMCTKLGEGLIGMVIERAEPINLSNAAMHPNYLYRPSGTSANVDGITSSPTKIV